MYHLEADETIRGDLSPLWQPSRPLLAADDEKGWELDDILMTSESEAIYFDVD